MWPQASSPEVDVARGPKIIVAGHAVPFTSFSPGRKSIGQDPVDLHHVDEYQIGQTLEELPMFGASVDSVEKEVDNLMKKQGDVEIGDYDVEEIAKC